MSGLRESIEEQFKITNNNFNKIAQRIEELQRRIAYLEKRIDDFEGGGCD